MLDYSQVKTVAVMPRDSKGKFAPKPDSLGSNVGLRIRKSLEGNLNQLVEKYDLPKAVLCRALVEGLLEPEQAEIVDELLTAYKQAQ